MDFDFSKEELTSFRKLDEALDACLEDRRHDEACDLDTTKDILREGLRCLSETEYLGYGLKEPRPASGSATMVAAQEKVASRSPSMFLALESSARLFGRAVATWGDEEQRTRWLEPLLEGLLIGGVGLSEETNNVVNDGLQTRGERRGDELLLSGRKGLVVNASIADWLAIVGLLDDGAALFVVPQSAAGLRVGARRQTAAFVGADFASVELEGCRVPARQVMGPIPVEALVTTLRRWEDQILTSASLGLMQRAFAAARAHAKQHKTGGKPIMAYQEISFKLAEMLTLLQTSQLLAYRAAWAADEEDDEAAVLADCAKVFCAESAEKIASEALQILGTAAFVEPNAVTRAFACSKLTQIAGTSSELARVRLGDDALRRWG
jgi:alkylation response protein AidB-like acyl-CoA dehydrogenase